MWCTYISLNIWGPWCKAKCTWLILISILFRAYIWLGKKEIWEERYRCHLARMATLFSHLRRRVKISVYDFILSVGRVFCWLKLRTRMKNPSKSWSNNYVALFTGAGEEADKHILCWIQFILVSLVGLKNTKKLVITQHLTDHIWMTVIKGWKILRECEPTVDKMIAKMSRDTMIEFESVRIAETRMERMGVHYTTG